MDFPCTVGVAKKGGLAAGSNPAKGTKKRTIKYYLTVQKLN